MNLKMIPRILKTVGIKARHIRPEVFTGVGVASLVGAGVWACVKTAKVVEAASHTQTSKDIANNDTMLSTEELNREIKSLDKQFTLYLIKTYTPPVIVAAVGTGLVIGGHRILRKENAALGAALTGVIEAFKRYRERVVNDLGAEADFRYSHGYSESYEVKVNPDGTESTEMTSQFTMSIYTEMFNESNPNWTPNYDLNMKFLLMQQNAINDYFEGFGIVFLNDVYKLLGFPLTEDGQMVGWVSGNGDDKIDFGLNGIPKYSGSEPNNDFYGRSILLDFNVDGYIVDLLKKRDQRRHITRVGG